MHDSLNELAVKLTCLKVELNRRLESGRWANSDSGEKSPLNRPGLISYALSFALQARTALEEQSPVFKSFGIDVQALTEALADNSIENEPETSFARVQNAIDHLKVNGIEILSVGERHRRQEAEAFQRAAKRAQSEQPAPADNEKPCAKLSRSAARIFQKYKDALAYPVQETIRQELNMGATTVSNAIKELRKAGLWPASSKPVTKK